MTEISYSVKLRGTLSLLTVLSYESVPIPPSSFGTLSKSAPDNSDNLRNSASASSTYRSDVLRISSMLGSVS